MHPEALTGLENLGNVGVVPIVIFLTQLIKKKIGSLKYGSDVLALFLSFGLCIGWEFYYMTPEVYTQWAAMNGLEFFKWVISDILFVGFGTWLAASKVYDLAHGNKKRQIVVDKVKVELEEKIIVLQNGNGNGGTREEPVEKTDLSALLRKALEERE